jgi:hypothetical protein
VGLLLIAGILALTGKKEIEEATPPEAGAGHQAFSATSRR